MSDRLTELLAKRPWLLADGATGTNYFAMGLATGEAPELWNLEQPEQVLALHRAFIDAGSDIILTNSFGGTRNRLRLHKAEDQVVEINRAAAKIARQAADEAAEETGRIIIVAGSIGPTGDLFEPLGPLTMEDGIAAFAEQAEGLAEGGVDVLWTETISAVEEMAAAVTGAGRTGLPLVSTMSFDTNGRTMMGVTPAQAAAMIHGLTPRPIAFGGNCGVGASELMVAMMNMHDAADANDVLVAKSNCGVPEFIDGEIQYSGTPELMADYARLARDAGIRIIGGCCGTTPAHIRAMREALEDYVPGECPSLEDVVARLGAISTGAEAQNKNEVAPHPVARNRRRGRRA